MGEGLGLGCRNPEAELTALCCRRGVCLLGDHK